MCEDFDVPDGDRSYLLKYGLKGDAQGFFEGLSKEKCRSAEVETTFTDRYSSDTKHGEISARLSQLSLDDCRENEGDGDYASLKALIAHIDRLSPITKREENMRIRILDSLRKRWSERNGSSFGLHATKRTYLPIFDQCTKHGA